jgi:hypothetical protein
LTILDRWLPISGSTFPLAKKKLISQIQNDHTYEPLRALQNKETQLFSPIPVDMPENLKKIKRIMLVFEIVLYVVIAASVVFILNAFA